MFSIQCHPTVADMTFPELDAYKHVISKEDQRTWNSNRTFLQVVLVQVHMFT